jgi:dienelactone hydrolase
MIERFAQMPSALRANARWERFASVLGESIPVMLVHPDWNAAHTAPVVIWMHGRTANKELDPGRYLRWMRAGIGACAVDLPGHGERKVDALQDPLRSFDVVRQMVGEIDSIVEALRAIPEFDSKRVAIGGMSAGGMAALARLCQPHPFVCASVEATSGSWRHQQKLGRQIFRDVDESEIGRLNPIENLEGWREIPLQAIHAREDEWVSFDGQLAFINALQSRYRNSSSIEFVEYDHTGAPGEHIGFGTMASDAKDRQRDFLKRWLNPANSDL